MRFSRDLNLGLLNGILKKKKTEKWNNGTVEQRDNGIKNSKNVQCVQYASDAQPCRCIG